jgi:2-polyprenyl-3-methyl-5-hydroxy-6-metoxy-1,4-benzoquinol methylase
VLPGGKIGLSHLAFIAKLLAALRTVLLIGCRGGTLATELHYQGRDVTVVDANPVRFDLARTYFWMPSDIRCVTVDPKRLLEEGGRT